MENNLNAQFEPENSPDGLISDGSEDLEITVNSEDIKPLDDSINLDINSIASRAAVPKDESIDNEVEEIFQLRGDAAKNKLAGVYFQGVQYFDLKNVNFINNTGVANLIDLLKSLLQQGVIIKFVNVKDKIKNKFKSLGLDSIFHFS